jgi:hypothetical protein
VDILQAVVEGVVTLAESAVGDNKPLSRNAKIVTWLLVVFLIIALFLFTLKMSE